ncbi:ATP-binding protein [Flavonifractor sp. AGMB03687]|uniref:ATP-binding protein n=1 Tax=Flavonifractor sp. AGMB03687 TaxID=2785133 RepID=UPI001AE0E61D|nr:ATP-binding protein [Flavonifractor sp. AGMB03687]
MTMETLRFALGGVAAYRHILETPELHLVRSLLDKLARQDSAGAAEDYAALFYALRAGNYAGLGDWLHDQLRYTESPYARLAEEGGSDPALEGAARRDVELFTQLCRLDCGRLISAMAEQAGAALLPVLEGLPRWPAGCPFTFEELTDFYRTHGSGLFARSRAFLWEDGELFPVDQPDCPTPDEMMGYELQRDQVIANTQALLEGHHVNNVLLFGDSGTGKSATVKSLLSRPGFEDLRLIEVQKEGLADMPRLIRTLGGRRLKFILFIDDLAFDQDDTTYSVMKTILEGGLERRPANVAIYATSNRRHLVRQTFSDRAGDEVDASETIQEKTSLAERFGLRIPYLALNKADFLDLVERMAAQSGITMDRQALRTGADRWEMRHPGRTPRTAKQYIASLSLT